MKRVGNIYHKLCDMDAILSAYLEVMKTTRNKREITKFNQYKCIYIQKIYRCLTEKTYQPQPLREVTIYEPKERLIVVQNIFDKIINHLVSRKILIPYFTNCLIDSNVASRKGYGTSKGRELYFKYRNICNRKYSNYYLLKIDISKFFRNINHDILKTKIRRRIKDKDVLVLLDKIIDIYDEGLPIGYSNYRIM